MTETERLSAHLLRRWREMRRDLLWLKYGAEWGKHDERLGKFWAAPPSDDEKDELALLLAIADKDCDANARDLLHEF